VFGVGGDDGLDERQVDLLRLTVVHHARDSLLPSSSTGSNVEISMTSLDRDAIQPHIVA
jgi:hypothetical protein